MEASFEITLQIVIAVATGIGAQVLAEYLKVPSIVFLLLFGILLGGDGIGLLHPQLLGSGLEVIVALATAVILFEGGLNLELQELGKVSGSLRNLVSIGAFITLLGGAMAAHWLSEFPWAIAFLYASLIIVTGPTVISPLLKLVKVERQVATLLEGEGVLIDPIGAIVAVVILDTVVNGAPDPIRAISGLSLRLAIGGGIGAVGGWLLSLVFKRAHFLSNELKNLVVLAGLWGLFSLAQSSLNESGLMATVIAGLVLGSSSIPQERLLRRFKGQLTILGVSVLFILLAADLSIASLFALGWGSLFTVFVLMFVVRPLNIGICTWNSDLNWRQKLFLCWVAPRGIVSASVASLFSLFLTERGINGGDAIKALVFLTIILTVVCQGLTARWVAKWLQITSNEATGAVIVGCNALSVLIARFFQQRGEPVVIIDTDPEAEQQAQAANIRVLLSSALDKGVLETAGLTAVGTFVAMTNNGEVNFVVAQRVAEEFQPPRVLAVFPRAPEAITSTPNVIQQAFLADFSLKTWNQYLENGQVKLGKTTFNAADFAFQQAHLQALIRSGALLPLFLERDDFCQIVPAIAQWQDRDRLIYLLHDPKPIWRQHSGTTPLQLLDDLPEVEEVSISSSLLQSAANNDEVQAGSVVQRRSTLDQI